MARAYHWNLDDMLKLYLDDLDMHGLIFWYNDALEMEHEIKNESDKITKGKK